MLRKTIFLVILFLSMINPIFPIDTNPAKNASLAGKVTDKTTGEPLPGVSIYFPDLKSGTLTNSDGVYSIDQLPAAKLLVQVRFVGYKMKTELIDLSQTHTYDFVLEESVTEISEIVVTGQSGGTEHNRTPSPIEIISRMQLLQNSATNIIDAIAQIPGVSQVTTGAGISKPVIRGLGYNRVVVVNDGIRQEGQQWGDEHGIEIDEYGVNHVEVLKGPASLAYGSDAMAGVINMLSAPTLPDGTVSGNIISNYQTNNGLVGYSADFSGNKKGLIWDARYSGKLAHAYENKYDGAVYNSGFRENAASALLGINRSWGFSHLRMSLYSLNPGIVEGERDELSGKFLRGDGEIATSSDFNDYQPQTPFQKIGHYKAVWNNSFFIGQGNLQTTFGFQQNHRKEFEDADAYGLYFLLNTLNYDVKYIFPEVNDWKFTLGVSGMWQQSKNKGSEFLVPAYKLFDNGIFAIVNRKVGKFDISGGLRFDQRSENGDALYLNDAEEVVSSTTSGVTERFAAFDQTFSGISGSLGSTYQISESIYTKLNISRGFRAPNIAELGSNGEHEGTLRYEIGNPDLKTETSLQLDWAVGMNTQHVSAELDLFDNRVNRYIFSHKLNAVAGGDSLIDDSPVFKFSEGEAHLYGAEFRFDIHPHPYDWLHFENTFSYIHASLKNQPDSMRYLPLIPATRWTSELKIDIEKINRVLANAYLKFGIDKNWAQNHFYAAYGTENRTPGYTLLNIGAGTDIVSNKKTLCSLFISVSNVTDVAYQSHLSRLKYGDTNNATGRSGIYNMGRNISMKLMVPINF